MTDIAAIAAQLSEAQRRAVMAMVTPHDAVPHRWIRARSYSSTWRKASKHYLALHALEAAGVVQTKVSRGETLWRLAKPLGMQVRAHLEEQADGE